MITAGVSPGRTDLLAARAADSLDEVEGGKRRGIRTTTRLRLQKNKEPEEE